MLLLVILKNLFYLNSDVYKRVYQIKYLFRESLFIWWRSQGFCDSINKEKSRSIFKRSTIPNKFKKFIVSDKFSQVASDPPRCVRNANHELIIIDPPPRVSKVDSNSLSLLLKVAASSAPDCEINETKRNTHKIYLVLSLTSRRGARWAPPPSPWPRCFGCAFRNRTNTASTPPEWNELRTRQVKISSGQTPPEFFSRSLWFCCLFVWEAALDHFYLFVVCF
jgi:hypothetical protein